MPAAVDAATGLPAAGPEGAVAGVLGDGATVPGGTVVYGHGGPNDARLNRVRVRPVREPSAAELLAREEARLQNELAAAAALEAQNAPVVAAVAQPQAPVEQAKRKGFLCKVFKKCDPPKARPGRSAPAPVEAAPAAPTPPTPPAT